MPDVYGIIATVADTFGDPTSLKEAITSSDQGKCNGKEARISSQK